MKKLNLIFLIALVSQLTYSQQSPNDFVTTWNTENIGTDSSNSTSITIPTHPDETYNYDVDWNNDGVFDEFGITGNVEHNYLNGGEKIIRIRGQFPRIYFNNRLDKDKIIAIKQWGNQPWTSMENAFSGCTNLFMKAEDTPNLS